MKIFPTAWGFPADLTQTSATSQLDKSTTTEFLGAQTTHGTWQEPAPPTSWQAHFRSQCQAWTSEAARTWEEQCRASRQAKATQRSKPT